MKKETNYNIGYEMAKKGYGISDSWGSTITSSMNGNPSEEELNEWIRGYETYNNIIDSRDRKIDEICGVLM